jgi:hypothetical protein
MLQGVGAPIAATHFSSMAIGVGRRVTPSVVRLASSTA